MSEAASGTLPETQVRAMFDRIAKVYDRMNGLMTAGMHHRWRARAADLAAVGPGKRALDVATGTGDMAVALRARGADVVGLDFSEAMLELARAKAPDVHFQSGNALSLPYSDSQFHAVTVGFGARNFSDLDAGLAELTRVTRAGGRVVVLEITTPQKPPLSWFFRLWFDSVVPRLGRLAGDPDAYTLPPQLGAAVPRAPRSWPSAWRPPASRTFAGCSRPGASSPCTWAPGRERRTGPARRRARRRRARGSRRALERTEERLAEVVEGHGPELGEHASATLAAGGKRLRPMLVFLAGAEGRDPQLLSAAVAVELLHMATLVHDDVLDRAPLRRGRPDRLRGGRAAGGHHHRRPALLARVRGACLHRQRARGARAVRRVSARSPGAS